MKGLEAQLTRHINHFLQTGVYVKNKAEEDFLSQQYMAKFVASVASEAGMAYIYANINPDNIHLVIPARKRLALVVAPLLLIADKVGSSYEARQQLGVTYSPNTTCHIFNFKGANGLATFHGWLARCLNDPVFKVALKTI